VTDAAFDPTWDAPLARLIHGSDAPLPERLPVNAGPLSLVLEAGDVRHVHVEGREVVRRIYGAVRDHAWRTIPAQLSGFTLERGTDTFVCRYRAEHRQGAVAFTWDATIEGAADGTLTFAFDGVADATFERNRIGLCLLHPLPRLCGGRVHVTTARRETRVLHFPDLVAVEQPIAGFDDIATLACEIGPDLWLDAAFDGDVFQAEDQRNWIDASTKIYSTPVALPRPVTVRQGTRIAQRITLRLRTERGDAAQLAPAPFVVDPDKGALRFGDGAPGRVPALGVRSAAALRHVPAAHFRVDVDLSAPPTTSTAVVLPRTGAERPPLELALRLPDDGAWAARALSHLDLAGVDVARVLAFTAGHDTTQPATLAAVRAWLKGRGRASTPIATGTASDLARIHLAPAPLVPGDVLCWAMDPQAHATDLTTIAETPDGARDQVRTWRQRVGRRPLAVAASFGRHGEPDPRAGSLFAAGWTLALVAALGEAGADSVTLLDPWPEDDPASLPVIGVLAALAPFAGAVQRPMASPLLTLRALWLEHGTHDVLFVANLAPRSCEVTLPPGYGPWHARVLDTGRTFASDAGGILNRLTLGPCAIAWLEAPRS
jgi:D-apionolactonase